jgi:hypothetical protein
MAVVLVLCGCASMKAALNTSPNMAAIPQGEGWFCYVTNPNTWSSCERTNEECMAAAENAKGQSWFTGGVTIGPCQPALQASCFTYEALETQADGTGKYVPASECVPDPVTCDTYVKGDNKIIGGTTPSDCVVVK